MRLREIATVSVLQKFETMTTKRPVAMAQLSFYVANREVK